MKKGHFRKRLYKHILRLYHAPPPSTLKRCCERCVFQFLYVFRREIRSIDRINGIWARRNQWTWSLPKCEHALLTLSFFCMARLWQQRQIGFNNARKRYRVQVLFFWALGFELKFSRKFKTHYYIPIVKVFLFIRLAESVSREIDEIKLSPCISARWRQCIHTRP